MATIVRVLRNYQITIPAEIRKRLALKEGTKLAVELRGNEIVLRPAKPKFPTVRLGRRITEEEAERALLEAMDEAIQ